MKHHIHNFGFRKALAVGVATLALTTTAHARDLTIVSFGGNFQDAQRELVHDRCATVGISI